MAPEREADRGTVRKCLALEIRPPPSAPIGSPPEVVLSQPLRNPTPRSRKVEIHPSRNPGRRGSGVGLGLAPRAHIVEDLLVGARPEDAFHGARLAKTSVDRCSAISGVGGHSN